MYTVIDLLRDQGIEKGLAQGIEQGRQEDIEKLLVKGALSPEKIASIVEVDLACVEEIARKVAGKE